MKNNKKHKYILVVIIFIILQILLSNTTILLKKWNKVIAANSIQTIADGTYTIRSSINNNYVLDVAAASTSNSANVQLYQSNNSNAQRFKVKYLGDGAYTLTAVHSNKLLDVAAAGMTSGTNVWQYQSNNSNAQKWIIKDVGGGYYSIISKINGLYLDAYAGIAKNGTNIDVYAGNGSKAQKFKFESIASNNSNANKNTTITGTKTVADGTYTIRSSINNNYVLDVAAASTSNSANVQLYQSNNSNAQRFKVKYLGDGAYTLTAVHSNKLLDVAAAGMTSGTNVWQYQSNNSNAQKWIIKDVGGGYYSIISKINGLYLDAYAGIAKNGTNIDVYAGNGSKAQKFKFESITNNNQGTQGNSGQNNNNQNNNNQNNNTATVTIKDGTYSIESAISSDYVIDVDGGSRENGGNIQLYKKQAANRQKIAVKHIGNGYYTLTAIHSNKLIDVEAAGMTSGTNVWQYENNNSDAQKWIIKDVGGGYYSIISKLNGLYLDAYAGIAKNGTNIDVYAGNGSKAQKFKFVKPLNILDSINTSKYPGYKEKISALMNAHPGWNFELLYTGLRFDQVIAGEAALHSRNLVPKNYGGEWICQTCGTKLYDSGWYCASQKATAYYMDPRNFLDDANVFQFQDINQYINNVCTLQGIQTKVKGTFLQNYATSIDNACKNKNVNSYYIIARVLQEQGTNGTEIGKGMKGEDGKTYYNPFNIGASGNGYSQIYANALATAKSKGWDSMQKALEGGIEFCKKNWLENYQNTLYQNKFDIDNRSGGGLYTHQYMQNLMAAYSEATTLRNMYVNTNKVESNFTFIIPVYEGMSSTVSQLPSNTQEAAPINVQITAQDGLWIREAADTSSKTIKLIKSGEIILSVQRGINSNWHKVITQDGTIGYMSGDYLKQVNDVTNCNYTAKVKTADGIGCNVRIGPSTSLDIVTAIGEGATVTVINEKTYNNIDGYNWYRVRLTNGQQGFMPANFLTK